MEPSDDVRRLRAEIAELRAQRQAKELDATRNISHLNNSLENLMASVAVCRIGVGPDLKILREKNTSQVFGPIPRGAHIADVFGTDAARQYFADIVELRNLLEEFPGLVADQPWKPVFPAADDPSLAFSKWKPFPSGTWEIEGARARVKWIGDDSEYYLVSPRELIGPEEDFRIEYTGCAGASPRDLSLVVGCEPSMTEDQLLTRHAEADGYAFAFGAMDNISTELQRQLLTIETTDKTLIVPGKEHRCVAERIGGLLRFSVDNCRVFSVVDALPLLGKGRGYVAFYTCATDHVFSDVRVFTRPSCIPPEIRGKIAAMQNAVLEVPKGQARYVKIHYLKPDRYLFSDVTPVIEARLQTEAHQKELQGKLAQADKMESLSAMAGGVAHDLNNILGPVVGFPQVIADQLAQITDGKYAQVVQDMRQDVTAIEWSAQRAAMVVQDLLTISRSGHYRKTPLDLNYLTTSALGAHEVLSLQGAKPGIHIITDLQSGLPHIMGSDIHLNRVIGNLIRNAYEAIDDKGTVSVSTLRARLDTTTMGHEIIPAGDYVEFKISDTGAGIDPANLLKLFQPFFSTKKRTRHSGSGLGLSVVHGIVKDHNGFIDVRSAPGKGTTFELLFPPSTEPVKPVAESVAPAAGGTGHILVVDDSEQQLMITAKFLKRLGYTCVTAHGGREAVKLLGQLKAQDAPKTFDLVLLDMIMEEDYDGLTTCENILKLYPGQKVIIVSGYSPTGRAEQAIRLGASWLAKPYTIYELAKSIRERLPG